MQSLLGLHTLPHRHSAMLKDSTQWLCQRDERKKKRPGAHVAPPASRSRTENYYLKLDGTYFAGQVEYVPVHFETCAVATPDGTSDSTHSVPPPVFCDV